MLFFIGGTAVMLFVKTRYLHLGKKKKENHFSLEK